MVHIALATQFILNGEMSSSVNIVLVCVMMMLLLNVETAAA